MNEQMIKNKIIYIMKKILSFQFDENMEQIEHKSFFSKHFNLAPFQLAYLLMEVEKEFQISIPESYLIEPGVKTISNFMQYILTVQIDLTSCSME